MVIARGCFSVRLAALPVLEIEDALLPGPANGMLAPAATDKAPLRNSLRCIDLLRNSPSLLPKSHTQSQLEPG
jgi:hypothetical protein